VLNIPESLVSEVLSESLPTAFAPGELDVQNFGIVWSGQVLPGVKASLVSGSLQWVRVLEVVVLPRARMVIQFENIEAGQVLNAGFVQTIDVRRGRGLVELPIALISGEKNPIRVTIKRGGQLYQSEFRIQLKPSPQPLKPRVFVDSSCSPYHFTLKSKGNFQNDWGYVGCRRVRVRGENYRTTSLEVYLYWDHGGQTIDVGGVPTPSDLGSLWKLRLRPEPGHFTVRAGNHELKMEYRLGKKINYNGISMGLGPYAFSFRGNGEDVSNFVAMPTLYASHFISDTMRIVEFGAVTLDSHLYSDLGLYLHFEQFRFLDQRVAINLLLGGHALGFRSKGQYYWITALPQGFEIVFTDAFVPGKNLVMGAFVYPPISGNAYYNGWVRWGNQVFVEANYIAWEAAPNDIPFQSSSLGLSFGFPLFKFW
jgi:hypothetical protein